jgi:hypothetical protein
VYGSSSAALKKRLRLVKLQHLWVDGGPLTRRRKERKTSAFCGMDVHNLGYCSWMVPLIQVVVVAVAVREVLQQDKWMMTLTLSLPQLHTRTYIMH